MSPIEASYVNFVLLYMYLVIHAPSRYIFYSL
jgi:hypothetical protein